MKIPEFHLRLALADLIHPAVRSSKALLSIILALLAPAIGRGESALQNADIGEVVAAGGASFQENTLHVQGSGTGMVQAGDSFHYVWQANHGDYVVTAKIAPGSGSEGAIVIRETEDHTAPSIWIGFGISGKINVQSRPIKGGAVTRNEFDAGGTEPLWLRVIRSGAKFDLAYSEDGAEWETFHHVSMSLPERSLAGFAVSGADADVVFGGFGIISSVVAEEEMTSETSGNSEPQPTETGTSQNQMSDSSNSKESVGSDKSSKGVDKALAQETVAGRKKIYVNKLLGSDTHDGLTSLKAGARGPKKSIQAALSLAKKGDEIIISSGSYTLSEINPSADVTITPVGEVVINP